MANEMQLIDKAALLTKAQEFGFFNGETHYFHYVSVSDIEAAPTIDALPLRCHMGDTVWVVGTKCLSGLYEEECDTYIHYGECECHLDKEYTVFRRKVDGVMFLYLHDLDENALFRWGETVFKTQEEAEAALAKMKEADHGE